MGDKPDLFGLRSVIYGANGSGKSTLAELLRRVAEGSAPTDVEIAFSDGDTITRVGVSQTSPAKLPYDLKVFNRDYVRSNLFEFLEGDGTCAGLVVLGEQNIADVTREEFLALAIRRNEARLEALRSSKKQLDQQADVAIGQAKSAVVDALAEADPAYYNSTRYSVAIVRRGFEKLELVALTDDELGRAKRQAVADTIPTVAIARAPSVDVAELVRQVRAVVMKTVAGAPLAALVENPDVERWVENGLRLHETHDECRFCEGELSAPRRQVLDAHFDSSRGDLRAHLSQVSDELERASARLKVWFEGLPGPHDLVEELRNEYRAAHSAVEAAVDANLSVLADLTKIVGERLGSLYVPIDASRAPEAPSPIVLALIDDVVRRNREAQEALAARRKSAAMAVEGHVLSRYVVDVQAAQRCAHAHDAPIQRLQQTIARFAAELEQIRSSRHQTAELAGQINAELHRYLGHGQLSVSVSPDGRSYAVRRNGSERGTHLSEGEQKALALLYFLHSLRESEVDPERTVVVVDDPVSSLDKEAVFAAYSLLTTRLEGFRQLVILTHDFEFFRLMREGLSNQYNRELKEPRAKAPRVAFLELANVQQETDRGVPQRQPRLRPLSRQLLRHTTEYHYLFWRIGVAVQDPDDLSLPLLPNAARRMLEGFLAFRAPSAGNLKAQIDELARRADIDLSVADRVYRFANALSHRREPAPSTALDFPSVREELIEVLRFIHEGDPDHFVGMEKACGFTPGALQIWS